MRKTITAPINYELELWAQGFRCIIGVDEAGRGAWAGPVAAGAACLPSSNAELSITLAGVRDSKQMTPRQRARLADVIKSVAVTWGVGSASAEEIGTLNIVRASCLAMVRALENAVANAHHQKPNFVPDFLLIDSIKCPEIDLLNVPYKGLVKGDQLCLSIAAASVLAKTWRDDYMRELDKQHPEYEFALHKGYGTTKHQAALKAFGASPHHRMTFSPLRRLSDSSA
jgi:ribonuclease HII